MSDRDQFPMPGDNAREMTIELFAAVAAKLSNLPGGIAAEAALFTMAYVIIAAAPSGGAVIPLRGAAALLQQMTRSPDYLNTLQALLTVDSREGAQ